MELSERLREHVPGLRAARIVTIESGWDSLVYDVDGAWIFRFPRRPEVAERMRIEAALLPELARTLPAPVPRFEVAVWDEPSFVGYPKLPGEPLRHGIGDPALGRRVGELLSALHHFPVERAAALGLPQEHDRAVRELVATFEQRVLPLLSSRDAARAQGMFDTFVGSTRDVDVALIHGDLGPDHVLHRGPELTGVLDWSDARIGDPALDLAWVLHGTGPRFAAAVLEAYGGNAELRERALFFHRLGPWHEVVYGLDEHRPELVESGLAAVVERLP